VQGDRGAKAGLFRAKLTALGRRLNIEWNFGVFRTEALMLGTLDLIIYGFVAVVLLPIVLVSLFTGSRPPENTFFSKYYHADKHLMLVGNVFLLAVCATAAVKLALHFGAIDMAQEASISNWLSVPFLMLLVIFLALLIRAVLRVRRGDKAA
jgi:hypothetical protein